MAETAIEGWPTSPSPTFEPVRFRAGDVIFRGVTRAATCIGSKQARCASKCTRRTSTPTVCWGTLALVPTSARSASSPGRRARPVPTPRPMYRPNDCRRNRSPTSARADPADALELVRLLGREVANRLRASTQQVAEHLASVYDQPRGRRDRRPLVGRPSRDRRVARGPRRRHAGRRRPNHRGPRLNAGGGHRRRDRHRRSRGQSREDPVRLGRCIRVLRRSTWLWSRVHRRRAARP